jgi:hypothetical protein
MSLIGTKGIELGCCIIGEQAIDIQGFPPCHTTLGVCLIGKKLK